MPVVLMAVAIAGGVMTAVSLWPLGWLVAILSAPLGGSLAAGLMALAVGAFRTLTSERPFGALQGNDAATL
jgi:hypothetical protein